MKWATDQTGLGVIAFATKKAALEAYPDRVAKECTFAMNQRGWLAFDRHGTENQHNIKTPDGREIGFIVSGWTPYGNLVGMRGLECHGNMRDHWQAIMQRVIKAGIERSEYKQENQ